MVGRSRWFGIWGWEGERERDEGGERGGGRFGDLFVRLGLEYIMNFSIHCFGFPILGILKTKKKNLRDYLCTVKIDLFQMIKYIDGVAMAQ